MTLPTESPAAGLKDFQLDTVAYVLRRLYDDEDRTDRFLVADEVGMGKTLVARGVIGGAIERLEHDDQVGRIDIVYICSNESIARQNIAKLDATGDGARPLSTRVTMLATQVRDLNRASADGHKTVNLVALTPETSFAKGPASGQIAERALLTWLLEPLVPPTTGHRKGLHAALRLEVSTGNWEYQFRRVSNPNNAPDPSIAQRFRDQVTDHDAFNDLCGLLEELPGRPKLNAEQQKRARGIVGRLRRLLASVSVTCLEPDLVILDEFQRFKHLLDEPTTDEERAINELAHDFFNSRGVKVLLLSATPYKLYTLAEERHPSGDDHYRDFFATFEFLTKPRHQHEAPALQVALSAFRGAVTGGGDPTPAKQQAEAALRRVMCRTERPVHGAEDMLRERDSRPAPPTAEDFVGFAAMKRIATEVGGSVSVDYWKSAPYFLNFMDGYQLSEKFRSQPMEADERRALLRGAQVLRHRDLRRRGKELDFGNARLRHLAADTVDQDLWKLLWLPPSMPYHAASGVYANVVPDATTKRLIFSSWAAAPSAIASLLSWTATRRMTEQAPNGTPTRGRLTYHLDGTRPAGMTSLLLFLPVAELAELTDPLVIARRHPAELLDARRALGEAEAALRQRVPPPRAVSATASQETWYWAAPLIAATSPARYSELAEHLSDRAATEDRGLVAHLQLAERAASGKIELGAQPDELTRWTALYATAAPGNAALRAIKRTTSHAASISSDGRVAAAAIVAAGFRSLFNRPEVMALLDQLAPNPSQAYWQTVLEYCHAGNLQAVLDEYLHHLVGNENPATDSELIELAQRIRSVIALRVAPLQAIDPTSSDADPLLFPTRFALRYGTARGTVRTDDSALQRTEDVQAAFNSPFWPMVLASTSVGQEGIDFHWWCHHITHWNLPANPVDFEQREGRVHRFKGHAVRKNVAGAHRTDALQSELADPWTAAFNAAAAQRPAGRNDLWPWWVYPGAAKIDRSVPCLPLSKDQGRERTLQRQRALYRLAFGQPRQEDLVRLLDHLDPSQFGTLRIDLRPPRAEPGQIANIQRQEAERQQRLLRRVVPEGAARRHSRTGRSGQGAGYARSLPGSDGESHQQPTLFDILGLG